MEERGTGLLPDGHALGPRTSAAKPLSRASVIAGLKVLRHPISQLLTAGTQPPLLAGANAKLDTGFPTAHALARYRCFLPDLAGLAGLRRAGPMSSGLMIADVAGGELGAGPHAGGGVSLGGGVRVLRYQLAFDVPQCTTISKHYCTI